jgi:hypothetical protein
LDNPKIVAAREVTRVSARVAFPSWRGWSTNSDPEELSGSVEELGEGETQGV